MAMDFDEWLKGVTPARVMGMAVVALGAVGLVGALGGGVLLARAWTIAILWGWLLAPTLSWRPPFVGILGALLVVHAAFGPRPTDPRGTAHVLADEAVKLIATLGLGLLARGLLA